MENIFSIQKNSMHMLEKIGIEVKNKDYIKHLEQNGFAVNENRVYINQDKVISFLQEIKYKKDKYKENIKIGAGNIKSNLKDIKCNIKYTEIQDIKKYIKLLDSSKNIDLISVDNIDISGIDIYEKIDLYLNMTNKPLVISKYEYLELKRIMNAIRDKSLNDKETIITLESDKYLSLDENILNIANLTYQNNCKVLINTPTINELSTIEKISLANAHIIGTMVILNSIFKNIDMIYGYCNLESRDSDSYIANLKVHEYLVKISNHYNLVNATRGSLNEVSKINQETGQKSMLSLYSVFKNSPNYILDFGGNLNNDRYSSYEKLVVDLEVLSMLKFYFNDLKVDNKTLDIDVVREGVESGGFLKLKNTFKLCRKSVWLPTVELPKKLRLEGSPSSIIENVLKREIDNLIQLYNSKEGM